MTRPTFLLTALAINLFSVTDSPNDYKFAFDIKQDAIITHSESISTIIFGEPLDISMQTPVQSADFPENLLSNLWR